MRMAKKYDFKPDKLQSGWLSKLYITPLQRRAILKWCLYGVILLVLSLLQDVILCHFRLFGATTELVPCGIILITILEGTQSGCGFALIAACLYWFSGTAPGPYAMVLITVLSILASMFRQGYLQTGLSAALLCTGVAMVLYELGVFAFGLFLGLTHWGRLGGFCLTALLSLLSAPLLYPLLLFTQSIGGKTWKE